MSLKLKLKYLFKCEFADGTLIEQLSDDTSMIEPGRSAFFDVLAKENESKILRFMLEDVEIGPSGFGNRYMVDLTDGHFEINGLCFDCNETLPDDNPERRLIFYRKRTPFLTLSTAKGHEGEEIARGELPVEYCIGWQTTINKKNHKFTITIR